MGLIKLYETTNGLSETTGQVFIRRLPYTRQTLNLSRRFDPVFRLTTNSNHRSSPRRSVNQIKKPADNDHQILFACNLILAIRKSP